MYTLGFYIEEPEDDHVERVSIGLARQGLRAIHPSRYVFRSPELRRQSLLGAAWIAPEMFQTGVVRAHVFPLRPVSKTTWEAFLAVSFEVPLAGSEGAALRREFGATLHAGPRVPHRFSRSITLHPERADVTATPTVTFLERVRLDPGRYTLTAVLSSPGSVETHATRIEVEVPGIPRREVFLVGPVIGRRSGPNLVITAGMRDAPDAIGGEASFEPLIVQQTDGSTDLVAWSQACRFGRPPGDLGHVARTLRDAQGVEVGTLPRVGLVLDSEGPVACQSLIDILPTTRLADGSYLFEARLSGHREDPAQRVRFTLGEPSAAAATGR